MASSRRGHDGPRPPGPSLRGCLPGQAVFWWRGATAGCLLLGGCQGHGLGSGVLDPAGPIGSAEAKILYNSLAIMLCIVVPTILATLGIAWWFRAGNARARYRPDWAYSGRVELVTWSIPVLVVLFLGGVAWTGSHALDPARPIPGDARPIEVQAVSLDWKWLFLYPDQHIATVNQLVLPAGTPIHFALTSASVMNVFFVPQLGSMIYTMNGMATQLWLQADHPGTYYGRSAHFSGDGFPGMQFNLDAVPRAQFEQWVQTAQAGGPTLDAARYDELERQSADVPPSTFRLSDPALFQAIVTQKLPPAPGPAPDRAPGAKD